MITKKTASSPIVFPPSLIPAVLFRFNAKDNPSFVLRNDSGIDYVVSYTDPISGITISQPTASMQPTKFADEVKFSANLLTTTTALNAQSLAVCLGSINLPFTYLNNPGDTYCFVDSDNEIALYGEVGTNNLRTEFLANAKVNNVSSIILQSNCTVYGERVLPNTSFAYLSLGAQAELPLGFSFRFVTVSFFEVVLFNRTLTAAEQTDLHNYFVAYHNI